VSGACATLASVTDPSRPAPGTQAGEAAFTAADLVRLTGGRLLRSTERLVRGAAVDSRLVRPGELFVALPGERTDGHRFLVAAAEAGAAALIVSRPVSEPEMAALADVTVVRVFDPLAALGTLAADWRRRFDLLVVGVTGSIAKTTTKEAVASVLGVRYPTLRNEGNLNNEIGLPITVLRLRSTHRAAVLEMGMYVGGEIADLAAIARPQIGVVTAVQAVHLSRIGSLDAIERAKGELVEALPDDGCAVLNADDPRVARMAARTRARTRTYGFDREADVTAEDVVSAGLGGMRFILRAGRRRIAVATPALGLHSVQNGLAAAAVGVEAGLDLEEIATGLARGWSAPHRTSLVQAGGVLLLDDTYNASPASMAAALGLLASLPGRRIAVLGEMLELGEEHAAGHRAVGRAAADAGLDLLLVVGAPAAPIAHAARSRGMDPARIVRVRDRDGAIDVLRPRLVPGDVVLLKASRGIALDLLVDRLRDELA
jgi:UDP-N-acetylmuramoyl-tripeptide--D-alanyl-D-alanine ligase